MVSAKIALLPCRIKPLVSSSIAGKKAGQSASLQIAGIIPNPQTADNGLDRAPGNLSGSSWRIIGLCETHKERKSGNKFTRSSKKMMIKTSEDVKNYS